jgi:hypothetical protein
MRELTKSERLELEKLSGAGTFQVTQTWLGNACPDATKGIRSVLREAGLVDYKELGHGTESRVFVPITYDNGDEAEASCYRTKTRGDNRINFKNLKDYAQAGDIMAISLVRGKVVLTNLSRRAAGAMIAVVLAVGSLPAVPALFS